LVGVDPRLMLHGNPQACERALARAGLGWDDVAVVEVNEAFASVALQFMREAGLEERWEDVNPNGGGISLGHPLGATGARVTATLLGELERRDARYGVATMCIRLRPGDRGRSGAPVDHPQEIVRAGYDAIADRYAEWSASFESPVGAWVAKFAERVPAGARVLELGCGGGNPSTLELARRYDYLGVDLSASQLARARRALPGAPSCRPMRRCWSSSRRRSTESSRCSCSVTCLARSRPRCSGGSPVGCGPARGC
jgi:hypothetical protein